MYCNWTKCRYFLLLIYVSFLLCFLVSAEENHFHDEILKVKSIPYSTQSSSFRSSLHASSSSSPQSHHFDVITQLTQSGGTAADLHKILHKLKQINASQSFTFNLTNPSAPSGKLLGMNKIASSIPTYIRNNTRLKRQLEGIFHVRNKGSETSSSTTTNPPVTLTLSPNRLPTKKEQLLNGNLLKRFRNEGGGKKIASSDTNSTLTTSTTKPENNQNIKDFKKIETIKNGNARKSQRIEDAEIAAKLIPDSKENRNYTVEIVEISRKTVIKEGDSKTAGDKPETVQTKPAIETIAVFENAPVKKNEPRSFSPRLRFKNLPKSKSPNGSVDIDNKKTLMKPSIKYRTIPDSVNTSNNSKSIVISHSPPQTSIPAQETPKAFQQVKYNLSKPQHEIQNSKDVEVKVPFQEQIPYNDRDIEELDLKDYVDGHSTFGAKGTFKHKVSSEKVETPQLITTTTLSHGVQKRNPTYSSPNKNRKSRSRGATNDINIEKVKVKQMAQGPRSTIYTATGVPIVEEKETEKPVYQYSSNTDKPQQFPKLEKSTLDELYRNGHPAVIKAPPKNSFDVHSIEGPYRGSDYYLGANPLVDDPPYKFDPESDRFYGNPTPDRVAQSNRPEPVQIENESPTTEQQDEEKYNNGRIPPTSTETNNYINERLPYERIYEPPEYDDSQNRRADKDYELPDTFIRDFVSLDNNFEALPRPTEDEENFRSLIPPEARTENENVRFEPDERGGGRDERDKNARTTDRNNNDRDEEGEDPSDYDPELESGRPTEDFDKSYIDALEQFDAEIKQIQESERHGGGVSTGRPQSSTGEPLLITSPGPIYLERNVSPGPAISYPHQRSAPRPGESTQPTQEENESYQGEEEEKQPEQRQHPVRDQSENRNEAEEEEGEGTDEETEAPAEERTTKRENEGKNEEEEEEEEEKEKEEKEEDSKDADESENVKINKVVHVKKDGRLKEDGKSANLDEDITRIEEEFGKYGVI